MNKLICFKCLNCLSTFTSEAQIGTCACYGVVERIGEVQGANGLRGIISDKDVNTVYTILKERNVKIDQTTWNRRYREYMEKIKTGSVFEIAEVLRNLFLLRHSKDLSFGERKMLDHAKHLLVKEISLAKKANEDIVEQEIQTIFAS